MQKCCPAMSFWFKAHLKSNELFNWLHSQFFCCIFWPVAASAFAPDHAAVPPGAHAPGGFGAVLSNVSAFAVAAAANEFSNSNSGVCGFFSRELRQEMGVAQHSAISSNNDMEESEYNTSENSKTINENQISNAKTSFDGWNVYTMSNQKLWEGFSKIFKFGFHHFEQQSLFLILIEKTNESFY